MHSPIDNSQPGTTPLKVLILGGAGLLGLHCVQEGLARGHAVSVLGRRTPAKDLPAGVTFVRSDISTASDGELAAVFAGQDAVVYSLGLDDREDHKRPAYKVLYADHVETCGRILRAAKAQGVRKFVVFGSYFTYFDAKEPGLGLSQDHAYIRSRREQRDMVLSEATERFDTFVFELPYIIGSLPGRVPPWSFLVNLLAGAGGAWFFSTGGTAAVTARQVARATMGAMETAKSGAYPLGGKNYSWGEMAGTILSSLGRDRKIFSLSKGMFKLFGWLSTVPGTLAGKQKGLSVLRFADFHYSEAFVDPGIAMKALGYDHEDYQAAMLDMVDEWKRVNRKK